MGFLRWFGFIWLIGFTSFTLIGCDQSPKLVYPPLSENASILAFGDSLTYGTGVAPAHSYPSVLAGLLNRMVINAGVPRETSGEGLARLPALLKQHQPELLILIHGGNDLLRKLPEEALKQNLAQMIELAQNAGIAVVMMNVPMPQIFLAPNDAYQNLASQYGLAIDNKTLSDILGKAKYKSDYVHPNAKGYAIMAQKLYDLLKQVKAL